MIIDKDMEFLSLSSRENASEHQKGFSLVDAKICGLAAMAVSTTIFATLPLIFVKKLRNNNDPTSRSRFVFIFLTSLDAANSISSTYAGDSVHW